jgi:hypothetical protein
LPWGGRRLFDNRSWNRGSLRELSRVSRQHLVDRFDACIDVVQSILERLTIRIRGIQLLELRGDASARVLEVVELIT